MIQRSIWSYGLIACCFLGALWACEKDLDNGTVSEARQKQAALVRELKTALQDADNGWVMMLKSNLSEDAYTPLVLKFDTTRNRVDMLTVYGLTTPTESYFEIGEGTSNPLLIFSTGSIITSLYRIGPQASDLTDHIFKVLDVTLDTLTVQCYRGGGIYAAEGGTIYQLFKRPKGWKWADRERDFDLENTPRWSSSFLNYSRPSQLKLTYLRDNRIVTVPIVNNTITNALLTTFRRNDPFNRDVSAKGVFDPFHLFYMYFTRAGASYQTVITLGHNSMSFYPFTIAQNITASTHVRYLLDYIGVHYLVVNQVWLQGNQLQLDFVAYGQRGEEIIHGEYVLN